MTAYAKLSKRPAAFRSLTGLNLEEFEALYQQVGSSIEIYHRRRLKRREREMGGGGQYRNDARNRLLMALIWLRVYPTYDVLGFIFDLDKSNVQRNLKPLLAVLRAELGTEIEWPDKTRRKKKLGEFVAEIEEVVAIVEATEQPTHRPQDDATQKQHYSGKKKRHTLKTQIVVGLAGDITVPGSQHDKKLYAESGVGQQWGADEVLMGDLGFQGIQHDHLAILPHKKPTGGMLTDAQKAHNRQISQVRVIVENTIARSKIFRVLADRYRHPRKDYNDIFYSVATLVNRGLARRPLRSAFA